MIIVITRDGKCAGISAAVGSIDTRILTEAAGAAHCEDLNKLSSDKPHAGMGKVQQFKIEVSEDDGSHRSLTAVHDPNNPWSTPLKRILNKVGMVDRI